MATKGAIKPSGLSVNIPFEGSLLLKASKFVLTIKPKRISPTRAIAKSALMIFNCKGRFLNKNRVMSARILTLAVKTIKPVLSKTLSKPSCAATTVAAAF